ncbi:Protein of unknown function (DUF2817) [Seminavis robusta]|uniref:DUF2817 domain-containing protein n=1 Tax=Seminavis robusta TaxID=568900 RepID=A0A9N8H807_9STRA|nr:Protein of unknown function (DUF2817) [Seminavis robusta]|eukprot:Sro80_g043070.1 Protein of unknown function (DUF2817) (485) ;mRNA; r:53496-54950
MAVFSLLVPLVVLALSVVLGYLAQQQESPPPLTTAPCTNDEWLSVSLDPAVEGWMASGSNKLPLLDPCHVFSETYVESRRKFRQAASKVGAEWHRLPIAIPPSLQVDGFLAGTDDDDTEYTIDIAVLYGTKPGLAVHTAGVHGVEGYAGAPIQIAFLESIYPLLKQQELPTMVLIHAVNPFGMAHYRRFNENNVDLNRNGLHPEEWKQLLHSISTTSHQDTPYAQFHTLFNPKGPPNWLYATVTLLAHAIQQLAIHGFFTLKAALVTGQYYDPKGIFYGGNELQPSLRVLYDFFQETLLAEKEQQSTTEADDDTDGEEATKTNAKCCTGTVTWIDVHTGLGPSGSDSLVVDKESMSVVEQQAPIWFPGAHMPHLSEQAQDVNKGYEDAMGFTPCLFRRLFAPEQNYCAAAQEFGTVPGLLVAHSLILENRAFHHVASRQEALQWAQSTTKRAFYKQTPTWRRQILDRGMQLWLQAIRRSALADD